MKKQYEVVYPDARKGETLKAGYVEIHILHNGNELQMNKETAILLAKNGYQIRLLPVDSTPGHRNPDALFVRESIEVEFKHNLTPTASAIDNEIRDAKSQADYVVLHVRSQITRGHLLKALKSRVYTSRNIRALWLIWQGELYYFVRKEIMDGTIDQKIQ